MDTINYVFKWLGGFCNIIDGIFILLTLGFYNPGLTLKRARYNAKRLMRKEERARIKKGSSKITEIICTCGITRKVPASKGKGAATYSFQCKGCKRYLSIHMEDDIVVSITKGSYYKDMHPTAGKDMHPTAGCGDGK